jgi:hypothetical protein
MFGIRDPEKNLFRILDPDQGVKKDTWIHNTEIQMKRHLIAAVR